MTEILAVHLSTTAREARPLPADFRERAERLRSNGEGGAVQTPPAGS